MGGHDEEFAMVGAVIGNEFVMWGVTEFFLGEFLEMRFGVDVEAFGDDLVEFCEDEFLDELVGDFVALVDIDCADEGFDGVGEEVGFLAAFGAFFAVTKFEILAEFEFAGDLGEVFAFD